MISATVSNLVVKVNNATGQTSGSVAATPLDWTNEVPAAGITLASNELFFVDGDLTGVNIADLVTGAAHFTMSSQTVDVPSLSLTKARLSTFSVSQLNLTSPFGLSISGGTIKLITLQPSQADAAAGDTRKWSAIAVDGLTGSLNFPGLSATISALSLKVNRAAGQTSANVLAQPLDWTTQVPAAGITLAASELLSVSGTLTGLNVFDLITGSASFGLKQQLVDVDFDGLPGTTDDRLDDATLLTIALSDLNLSVGLGGAGLTIGPGGALAIATIKPKAPTSPATDTRSWTAIVGKDLALGIDLPGISGTVSAGVVQINRASGLLDPTPANATSGDEKPATALNWATDAQTPGPLTVDLDPAGAWTAPAALVDPGQALPSAQSIPITLRGQVFSVSAKLTGLDLFGLLTGSADFAISSQLVDVDFDGQAGTTTDRLEDASLVMFALTNLDLALGVPGVGVKIGPGGTVGIASIKAPTPASGTDTRTWTAIVGKNLAVTLDLPGIAATVTSGSLKINRVTGERDGVEVTEADALNWATADAIPLPLTVDLNSAGTWTAPTALVDPGQALPTPTFLPVTLRGSQLAVAGSLTGLNIFGFVTGAANFAITIQTVDVDLDGDGSAATGEQLDNAQLITVALDQLNLSIGAAGAGLAVTSGSLGIALLAAPTPASGTDTRSWLSLSASNLGITLAIPGISATVTNGSVQLNRASGAKDGTTNTTSLNWVTTEGGNQNGLVDFNSAGGYTPNLSTLVDPGAALSPPVAMPVKTRGDVTAVAGTLTNLNVFGLLTGSANFAMVSKQVDVDLDGSNATTDDRLDNATLLTIGLSALNLSVGAGGAGLAIGPNGTVGIAVIKAPVPTTQGATDTRSWTAITAKNLQISLSLPAGVISATVSDVSLKINRFAGEFQGPTPQNGTAPAPVLATALPWASSDGNTPLAVDLDPAGGWTAPASFVDPGQTLQPAEPMPVKLNGEQLAVAGKLTNISIFGFITGMADFEIATGTILIDLPAAQQDPINSTLLTFGLSNASLTIGDANGINFSISGASLALAIAKAGAPAGTNTADNRSWLGLKGTIGTAQVNGLPSDMVLTMRSITVEVNRASGAYDPNTTVANDEVAAAPLNWLTQISLDNDATTGENPADRLVVAGKTIDFTGDFLRASGRVDVNLFGFVSGSVAFAFQQQTVDVNVDGGGFAPSANGDLDNAKLTTLALNILSDDGDSTNGVETGLFIGAPDKSIGFSVAAGSLAIATIKPADTADNRSWSAITASIQSGTFSGGGPLKATVNSLGIEINQAVNATALNWSNSVDLQSAATTFAADAVTITVDTGGPPIVHNVNYATERKRATGSLSVDIFGFITGTVGFSYEAKTVDARVPTATGTEDLDDASLTLISLSVTSVFIGVPNGPGFRMTGGKLSLAMLKPGQAAVAAGDARSWMGLTATLNNAAFEGLGTDFQISATGVSATINRGSGLKTPGDVAATALNWETAIDTDPAGGFVGADTVTVRDENNVGTDIKLSGDRLRLSATRVDLNVLGFVRAAASLEFELADSRRRPQRRHHARS